MRIDSHHHFWRYDPLKDAWITDEMAVLKKHFFPGDLQPLLADNHLDGCITIQADQTEAETENLVWIAENYTYVKGVVGWVDLGANDLAARLQHYRQFKKLKGFRHLLQAEPNGFMLDAQFNAGIDLLTAQDFTYDILIQQHQLAEANEFVSRHPQQLFVLDHMAKPDFKSGHFSDWEAGINVLAHHSNVYCKLSGLVTQADLNHWTAADFDHCLRVATRAFGIERLMFGSDWPVCNLAANYAQTLKIIEDFYANFPKEEQEAIMGGNAIKFYGL